MYMYSSTTVDKVSPRRLRSPAAPLGSLRPKQMATSRGAKGKNLERDTLIVEGIASDPSDTLWVKAPEYAGWVYKKGFAWRRAWTKRWVVIQGRELSYFEAKPTAEELRDGSVDPRGTATLQKDFRVEYHGLGKTSSTALDFTLYPGQDAQCWELRACSDADYKVWQEVLDRCVALASWLSRFQMGGLLGVGAAAVVREVMVRATGEKFALKIVTINDAGMRDVAVQEVELLQRGERAFAGR